MEKQRSVGVTIFGWFFVIAGLTVLGFCACTFLYTTLFAQKETGLTFLQWQSHFHSTLVKSETVGTFYFWLAVVLLLPILWVISGMGILKLKNWGRRLILLLALFAICLQVMLIIVFSNIEGSIIRFFIAILLNGCFLYYFTRPSVKEQFR